MCVEIYMRENKWRLLGHNVFRQTSRNGSKMLNLLFLSTLFMFGFYYRLFQEFLNLFTDRLFILFYCSEGEWGSKTVKFSERVALLNESENVLNNKRL